MSGFSAGFERQTSRRAAVWKENVEAFRYERVSMFAFPEDKRTPSQMKNTTQNTKQVGRSDQPDGDHAQNG